MQLTFELAPPWMTKDHLYCRSCDKPTSFVVIARGHNQTFPCCDDPECQIKVKAKIRLTIRSRIKGFYRRMLVLLRWWRIIQATHHRQDWELMRNNHRLWATMHGLDY